MHTYTPSPLPGDGASSREHYEENPVLAWIVFMIALVVCICFVVLTIVAWMSWSFWFVVFGFVALVAGSIAGTVVYGWLHSLRTRS